MGSNLWIRKNPGAGATGLLTSPAEIMLKPSSGTAWNNMKSAADATWAAPDLSDQEDVENVRTLARAFVYTRIGGQSYYDKVVDSIEACMGTEQGGRTLALGRELGAYIAAADLIGLPSPLEATFKAFCEDMLTEVLQSKTLQSTDEHKPNNWRGHCSWTRACIAVYCNLPSELADCATVQHGWLGNRSVYMFDEDDWGDGGAHDLDWHADLSNKRGINAVGATIEGHSVDGVLPDDQRRDAGSTGFSWPAPPINYVYECLQGILGSAIVLDRKGYDVWNWESQAIKRAFLWLHDECDEPDGFPPTGDDRWQNWVVNKFYNTTYFPTTAGNSPGKNLAWTDWLYGPDA